MPRGISETVIDAPDMEGRTQSPDLPGCIDSDSPYPPPWTSQETGGPLAWGGGGGRSKGDTEEYAEDIRRAEEIEAELRRLRDLDKQGKLDEEGRRLRTLLQKGLGDLNRIAESHDPRK